MSQFREMTDDQLANRANQGLSGQGAPVEATRRLREAVESLDRSSTKLATRMLWLTVVIMILTAVMVVPLLIDFFRWLAR